MTKFWIEDVLSGKGDETVNNYRNTVLQYGGLGYDASFEIGLPKSESEARVGIYFNDPYDMNRDVGWMINKTLFAEKGTTVKW